MGELRVELITSHRWFAAGHGPNIRFPVELSVETRAAEECKHSEEVATPVFAFLQAMFCSLFHICSPVCFSLGPFAALWLQLRPLVWPHLSAASCRRPFAALSADCRLNTGLCVFVSGPKRTLNPFKTLPEASVYPA